MVLLCWFWNQLPRKKLNTANENFVGSSIQLRERLDRGLLVNKHVYSRGQSCRHSCWRGSHMMRRRMSETSKIWLNPVQELSRRKILRVQELPREAEKKRSTIHSLCSWEPSLVTWSSPEAKHDQGKIVTSQDQPGELAKKFLRKSENVPGGC